jgi:hypothetical protein
MLPIRILIVDGSGYLMQMTHMNFDKKNAGNVNVSLLNDQSQMHQQTLQTLHCSELLNCVSESVRQTKLTCLCFPNS